MSKRKPPAFLRLVETDGEMKPVKPQRREGPAVDGKAREEQEAKSPAIKAAVRYLGAMAAMHEGFNADHTSDNVVAGFGGGGAETQLRIARRALNKLILSCRLSRDASPVEMAAKASVAKFIMVQWRSKNWEIQDPKDNEGLFLDAFADQVEEMCIGLYSEQLQREGD